MPDLCVAGLRNALPSVADVDAKRDASGRVIPEGGAGPSQDTGGYSDDDDDGAVAQLPSPLLGTRSLALGPLERVASSMLSKRKDGPRWGEAGPAEMTSNDDTGLVYQDYDSSLANPYADDDFRYVTAERDLLLHDDELGTTRLTLAEFRKRAWSEDVRFKLMDIPQPSEDGTPIDDPFSYWIVDYEVRDVVDGKAVRKFRYRRKTDGEWNADGPLREQWEESTWRERSQVFSALQSEDLKASATSAAKAYVEQGIMKTNPYAKAFAEDGGRLPEPRTKAYQERKRGKPGPNEDMKSVPVDEQQFQISYPMPTRAQYRNNELEYQKALEEWEGELNDVRKAYKTFKDRWDSEYDTWRQAENKRSKRFTVYQNKQIWDLQYADEVSRLQALTEDPASEELLRSSRYPWEALGPPPREPAGVGIDSMLHASYERKVASHTLKAEAIRRLYYYMDQTQTPLGAEDFYYSGPHWRARCIVAEVTANLIWGFYFSGDDSSVPRYLVAPGGEAEEIMKRHIRIAQAFDFLMPIGKHSGITPKYPSIEPCITVYEIQQDLESDGNVPWVFKTYPQFVDFWRNMRSICFNAMLFNTGIGSETTQRERSVYEHTLTFLTSGRSGAPDDREWIVVGGEKTCLDIEMLRFQYEEFEKAMGEPDSYRLAGQRDYSVHPAVPWAKHEHYLGQLVDQLASDPFAMPLYRRWIAPRFWRDGGNPALWDVWDELYVFAVGSGYEGATAGGKRDRYQALMATPTPEGMDEICWAVADRVYFNKIAPMFPDAPTPVERLSYFDQDDQAWLAEAAQYVTDEPQNPAETANGQQYVVTTEHYKRAAYEMAMYLLKRRDVYLVEGMTMERIERNQRLEWVKVVGTPNVVTLEDIIYRRKQAYYTGETEIAINNLKNDLTALFDAASARYDDLEARPSVAKGPSSARLVDDFFDNQYGAEHLRYMGINARKFLDMTLVCRRYYLDGYESSRSLMDIPAQRKQDDDDVALRDLELQQLEKDLTDRKLKLDRSLAEPKPVPPAPERYEYQRRQEVFGIFKTPEDIMQYEDKLRKLKQRQDAAKATVRDFERQVEAAVRRLGVVTHNQRVRAKNAANKIQDLNGKTLSRIDTIRKLRAELWKQTPSIVSYSTIDKPSPFRSEQALEPYKSLQFVDDGDDAKGNPCNPSEWEGRLRRSLPWEWRRRMVLIALKSVTEGSGSSGIFASVVRQIQSLEPKLIKDNGNGTYEINELFINRIGLHTIARFYYFAQLELDLPSIEDMPGLDRMYVGPEPPTGTYATTVERIRIEGVPPVCGVPRDMQAGTVFWARDTTGSVTDSGDPDDMFTNETTEVFLERLKDRERNNPIAYWCDLYTGELRVDDPRYFGLFDPHPQFFEGGVTGEWWQQILQIYRLKDLYKMDSLREVADYLVNGVWEKEDNHGWKRQYHEEGGAVFGRDGKMIPVTFGPGYPRMEPPTSRELPPPLPLLPMPEPEPLPIPMPGNVPAAMEEEPPAAPPVAVNPWDRQPPELFMPPYPSWHPINAGRKETDEHVVALGEREKKLWKAMNGFMTAAPSKLKLKAANNQGASKLLPSAYMEPSYYT